MDPALPNRENRQRPVPIARAPRPSTVAPVPMSSTLFRLLAPVLLLALPAAAQDNPGTEAPAAVVTTDAAANAPAAAAADSTTGEPAAAPGAAPSFVDETIAGLGSFGEVIRAGGVVMIPIFFLAFLTLTLIILFGLTIRRGAVITDRFMDNAENLLRKEDYLGLLATCTRRGEAVARVCQKAIEFSTKNPSATFPEVREVAEAEGVRQASQFSQRITYLADIGGIAPMIGLLGTVMGMIRSFRDISVNTMNSGVQHATFAGGIAEAMVTTASGLVISIVALCFYAWFRGKVAKYIAELESASTHLIALMGANYHRRIREARRSAEH